MNPGNKFRTDGEFYLLATLILLGVVFFSLTWSYSATAALFPRMVSFAAGVLSLYTLAGRLKAYYKEKKVPGGKTEDSTRGSIPASSGLAWYWSLLAMAAYFFLICMAGFVPATLVYLLCLPLVMGYRNRAVIVMVAVICAAVISYSFSGILRLPLPEGWLGRLWS